MTKELDHAEIARLKDLLFVVDECRGYPGLKALHDAAMEELVELNNELHAEKHAPVAEAPVATVEETDEEVEDEEAE